MKNNPIIIVSGEPNSIFFEIFFKMFKKKKIKSPLILIGSNKVLNLQMKKLNFYKKIRLIDPRIVDTYKLDNKTINIIDVKYDTKKAFEKISFKSKSYIENCFEVAINIINSGFTNKLINGPVSKKNFLGKKYPGVTEYLASKYKKKKFAMLIYNKNLSVCPITTHLPLKNVSKKIKKKIVVEKVILINNFFKAHFKIKPQIAIAGLNPHCENFTNIDEDNQILKPTIKYLYNLGLKVFGPFPADTIFMKKNRDKYNVIVGMYHDQVLAPFKSLFKFNAINITLGLKYIRVSPDHGVAIDLVKKGKANEKSFYECINFIKNF